MRPEGQPSEKGPLLPARARDLESGLVRDPATSDRDPASHDNGRVRPGGASLRRCALPARGNAAVRLSAWLPVAAAEVATAEVAAAAEVTPAAAARSRRRRRSHLRSRPRRR